MILSFLGTSGANAFPEAFCKCDNCEEARMLGGESLRKRSAVLINDDLLIDLGPDIMVSSQMHKINLSNVSYCIQTHPHADHLDASHMLSRSPDHGVVGAPCLNYYASQETLQIVARSCREQIPNCDIFSPGTQEFMNLALHTVRPYEPFEFGAYQVIPFPANHAPGLGAMLYALTSNNRTIFYGTDSGIFREETWTAFHRFNLTFEVVILDHTYGVTKEGEDHLNARSFVEHIQRMKKEALLSTDARLFATHFAHSCNPVYPKLSAYARQHGYEIAYDGLQIEV